MYIVKIACVKNNNREFHKAPKSHLKALEIADAKILSPPGVRVQSVGLHGPLRHPNSDGPATKALLFDPGGQNTLVSGPIPQRCFKFIILIAFSYRTQTVHSFKGHSVPRTETWRLNYFFPFARMFLTRLIRDNGPLPNYFPIYIYLRFQVRIILEIIVLIF